MNSTFDTIAFCSITKPHAVHTVSPVASFTSQSALPHEEQVGTPSMLVQPEWDSHRQRLREAGTPQAPASTTPWIAYQLRIEQVACAAAQPLCCNMHLAVRLHCFELQLGGCEVLPQLKQRHSPRVHFVRAICDAKRPHSGKHSRQQGVLAHASSAKCLDGPVCHALHS